MPSTTLSPTSRTSIGRGRNRMVEDRAALHELLADALVAHLGVTVERDGASHPLVLPTAYAVDLDGPDRDGTLYLHGSVAAGWLRASTDRTVCVTVTELDGLVAGRSAFHHSMNYRSAVVIGRARLVDDAEERQHALDLIVDHMIPGRSATLRPSTRKELVATAVLAVPLHEASMKARAGGPVDEPSDVEAGVWGGHIPLRRVAGRPVPDADSSGPVPADVVGRAAAL
ncbi:pyridoxamine 5'-phosphate oxidase family protein [Nocardioides sp. MAH-18]|uniref:Pyridoxamine 5'-phosphate oxidase family protein n=1 Tax=Nocardioides agri TaxID=2682843 RepID=A0A6L6XKW9_9ACTN|nr:MULTISPECIES: pyridoxamine 5'-phosphate oxidase family protein [unclassified Nocardioides]MBA2956681.1 pyridoxamine 5'-phosphate oxidase family protein [Nocardioides sp. CGMCC 1.13656]MVQ47824.1 pyridoxamine 5'-phosphate oxidase family protein [Nocardioides sp. MAH-18]